jgi:3-carboxy-cis,cis-muconate cycloisomerase
VAQSQLFGPSLGSPEMDAAVADRAWLAAMLEVEAALAEAEAECGLVPVEAASAIRAACDPARFDLTWLGQEAAATAVPVVPLVRALTAAAGEAGRFVHLGATSQDVMDTAMVLVARRGLEVLGRDLEGVAAACADLAQRHRDTPMVGRTLLQQAVPITFGLKAAGWLVAVEEAADRLARIRLELPLQLGGAAGTLASLGDCGLSVMAGLARRLGLAEPVLPWHAARGRIAELGAGLAIAAGVLAKIALDVVLMAQTEVAELAEGTPGTSSAMPQKQNPVSSIEVRAAARGVRAQAMVLLEAMEAEHERAAGAWQAEWPAVTDALRLAGGAAARTRRLLEELRVRPERMRANIEIGGGLALSEAVSADLAPAMGRERARRAVEAAAARAMASGRSFRDELLSDDEIRSQLGPDRIDALLDPARRLGSASGFVERAIAAHRRRRKPT